MDDTYIKLARSLLEKPIMQNSRLLHVWVWCLLKATRFEREDTIGLQKIKLLPGQFVTGRLSASEQLKIKPSTLWKILKWLESNESVTIQSNNKFSLITVVNYELYQVELGKSDSKNNSNVTTNGQQSDTNNKDKKDKNIKHIYAKYVRMTEDEYQKLVDRFGEKVAKEKIETLNEYKGSKGKKYADDYLTILSWDRKDKKSKPNQPNRREDEIPWG